MVVGLALTLGWLVARYVPQPAGWRVLRGLALSGTRIARPANL